MLIIITTRHIFKSSYEWKAVLTDHDKLMRVECVSTGAAIVDTKILYSPTGLGKTT